MNTKYNTHTLGAALGAALSATILLMSLAAFGHGPSSPAKTSILADLQLLKELNIPISESRSELQVGLAHVNAQDLERISTRAHELGRCGGYERLDESEANGLKAFSKLKSQAEFEGVYRRQKKAMGTSLRTTAFDPKIKDAVREVSEGEIGNWISWLVGFGGRYHASSDPNVHTRALADRLRQLTAALDYPATVDLIDHDRTRQQSVRLRLTGSQVPDEIVVLGGHLDSINHSFGDQKSNAPGADDNASGSSALLESLRIILKQGQPTRTVEYFWYAGEEAGLLGSAEIARQYREQSKNVIGVLQLDMTLHPGSGEGTIASITDNTSGWLRDLLAEMNRDYLNVQIVDDKCGYGCSDHASWFKEGYSTLMPFEASMRSMNRKIHTADDRLAASSSLKHAAIFAKIAVAYALTLQKGKGSFSHLPDIVKSRK